MYTNGVRPNAPLINADGEQVGNARTYGDAMEQAGAYASETGDQRSLIWNQPVRFDILGGPPANPIDPIDEELVERPFVTAAINYGDAGDGSGDRWATDPSARLFERDYFKPNSLWRIPNPEFTYFPGGVFIPPMQGGTITFEVKEADGTIHSHTWQYDFT